jgi:hypothetical protein
MRGLGRRRFDVFKRILLYEPATGIIFLIVLPVFFTVARFSLAILQGTPSPYMPGLSFRFLYIPGEPLPIGRWFFFMGIVLIFLVVSYLKLPKEGAIERFQGISAVYFVLFWGSWILFLALFWLRLPVVVW